MILLANDDFPDTSTLQKMCWSLIFTISNDLVMITEQKFGFDRHGYFPLFANSYISQTT